MYSVLSAFWRKEAGVAAILVGIMLFMLVGLGAIVVELARLYVAQNELRNAADAGALAGASELYVHDENDPNLGWVNPGANQIGYEAAIANKSHNNPVEVNAGDVLRGHWSFATRKFDENPAINKPTLWGRTDEELDADLSFINAVQVTTRREATPIVLYFTRLFGIDEWPLQQTSVAYIGFAGTLYPFDVDQPFAICRDKILNDAGEYTCEIGRAIHSGSGAANQETQETGGWSDLTQGDGACTGGTNTTELRPLICSDGNLDTLVLGDPMTFNNGNISAVWQRLFSCWDEPLNSSNRTKPWQMALPVVLCEPTPDFPDLPDPQTTCKPLVGAVEVNVMWISDKTINNFEQQNVLYGRDIPASMEGPPGYTDWQADYSKTKRANWIDFLTHFNLPRMAESDAGEYIPSNTIYFLPDCKEHEPKGVSGGENFGILAKIPVLVD